MLMSKNLNTWIDNSENVARAIFSPAMVDDTGKITKAAFHLRHNEDYFSVSRMNVKGWMTDIKSIPTSNTRVPYGYSKMNVGEIRSLDVTYFDKPILFDVEDKSSTRNKSHAGISVSYDGNQLKGDKSILLKPLQELYPASMLLLKIQAQLTNLANKNLVKWPAKDNEE